MARVNAVANLKWKQVNLEERICTDVIEKEGKIVELSFSVETKNYLETRFHIARIIILTTMDGCSLHLMSQKISQYEIAR